MIENPEDMKNDSQINLPLPEELRDAFDEHTDNKSETLRRLMHSYVEAEDRYEVGDDMKHINVLLLKTYRNAINNHIQLLENQVDKLNDELEKFEKEKEDGEVLVEIDLDIATKNL